ncbi:MAG: hypothetical protein NDJ92_12025 [Thermoanaerobaculia bacterium]|nr:hypothetical protein [Thermoanaerobaculia bacterium]
MIAATELLDRVRHEIRATAMSVNLMLERRAWKFVIIDALVVLQAAIVAFAGEGEEFFGPSVLLPLVILGVPIMADAIALERRAGTLDLALSSPGSRIYFERRVFGFCAAMLVQAILIVVTFRFVLKFHLLPPLVASVASCAFLGALVLFWSTRLTSTGGVTFATYLSCFGISPWLFANPVYRWDDISGPITALEAFAFARQTAVIALTTVVLYLYAARRLSRPEEVIS